MGWHNRALFVLILCLAAAGCRSGASNGARGGNGGNAPELAMEGVVVQAHGEQGLDWQMRSPQVVGYTSRNILQAKDLAVELFQNGKRSSEVRANSGLVNTEKPEQASAFPADAAGTTDLAPGDMRLSGDVVITSTEGARLSTDWLLFDRGRNVFRSTAPVELVRVDSVTRGVGMEASGDLSRIEIFNQTVVISDTENP